MARSHKIQVEVIGDSSSLTRAFSKSSRAARSWNKDLKQSSRGAIAATVGFSGLGRALALGSGGFLASAAIGSAIKKSIEGFTAFQDQMQKTVGLASVAQSQVKGFSKEILALAPATGKGPQELANAFFFVASSGIEAAKAMDVVKVSAEAAVAGLGDTAQVADAVTSVINAYGAANISAAQAADVLAATVREGKGEASQFAPVIGNVVALASQLGVSFDQVGAALAAQTRLGTDAETTAIQLQRVFSALLKVTPKSAEAFKSVGLNADQLREDLASKGLLNVLQQVKVAFAGNLPAMAKAFGDVRGFRGVLNLVGKQAEQTRQVFDRLANSSGSAAKAFQAVNKDAAQQFRKLSASVQVLAIQAGSALTPAILQVVRPLNQWFSSTKNQHKAQRELTQDIRGAADFIRGFVAALKPLVENTREAAHQLGGVKNAVKLLTEVLIISKLASYAVGLTNIGLSAEEAAKRTNVLRGSLLRLGLIGVITVGIEVIINRQQIQNTVNGFLRDHGAGFLTGKTIKIPAKVENLDAIKKLRAETAKVKGENDLLVKVYDKVIAKLEAIKQHASDLRTKSQEGHETTFTNTKPKTTDAGSNLVNEALLRRQAIAAAKRAAAAAKKAFESTMANLDLGLAKAGLTPGLKDDLAILKQQEAAVRARIAVTKNNIDLQQQLVDIQSQELDIQKQVVEQQKQAAENRRNAIKAKQFKALGLTSDGETPVPSLGALRHKAAGLTEALKGTVLDTGKTGKQLKTISKFLSTHFKGVGKDVRSAILEMLNDISGALEDKKGSLKGPLTKTHALNTEEIAKGLGLDETQTKELRSRLSKFNTAGRALSPSSGPHGSKGSFRGGERIVVESHVEVNIDGKKVGSAVTRSQQQREKRNPPQKRGPNRH